MSIATELPAVLTGEFTLSVNNVLLSAAYDLELKQTKDQRELVARFVASDDHKQLQDELLMANQLEVWLLAETQPVLGFLFFVQNPRLVGLNLPNKMNLEQPVTLAYGWEVIATMALSSPT